MSGAPALRSWRWLAAALVVLAFAGCSQSIAGQAKGPSSPSPPGDAGTRPEHGGGNLGGGGDSM
jgi:hypothetical protein